MGCYCGPVQCRDTAGRYGAIMALLTSKDPQDVFTVSGYCLSREHDEGDLMAVIAGFSEELPCVDGFDLLYSVGVV